MIIAGPPVWSPQLILDVNILRSSKRLDFRASAAISVTTCSQLGRGRAGYYDAGERWGARDHPRIHKYGDDPVATDVESSEGGTRASPNVGADAPTRELPTAPATASEDRCGNCGTPLAHDQRYCVECGERRGQSRFPTAQPTTEVRTSAEPVVAATASPARVVRHHARRRRRRAAARDRARRPDRAHRPHQLERQGQLPSRAGRDRAGRRRKRDQRHDRRHHSEPITPPRPPRAPRRRA